MTNFLQSRELVRAQPFRAQKTFINQAVGNGAQLLIQFDISLVSSDRNQLHSPGGEGIAAVGPWLDSMIVSDGIGAVDILFTVDEGGTPMSILPAPLAVVANTPLIVAAGMRITARYVTVVFTAGAVVTVAFGAYVGSA